jgi:hypothetical protein
MLTSKSIKKSHPIGWLFYFNERYVVVGAACVRYHIAQGQVDKLPQVVVDGNIYNHTDPTKRPAS